MFEWLKQFFSKFATIFMELIDEALPLARKIIVGQLKEFAVGAVKSIDGLNISNEDKRKKAFAMIESYARTNAIKARDSIINLVIELAVLRLKKED